MYMQLQLTRLAVDLLLDVQLDGEDLAVGAGDDVLGVPEIDR